MADVRQESERKELHRGFEPERPWTNHCPRSLAIYLGERNARMTMTRAALSAPLDQYPRFFFSPLLMRLSHDRFAGFFSLSKCFFFLILLALLLLRAASSPDLIRFFLHPQLVRLFSSPAGSEIFP